MYTTYILHSRKIDKYYVGFTSMDMQQRLRRHLSNHRGFTGRTDDWQVVFSKSFSEKSDSLALEKSIKRKGALRFLGSLN